MVLDLERLPRQPYGFRNRGYRSPRRTTLAAAYLTCKPRSSRQSAQNQQKCPDKIIERQKNKASKCWAHLWAQTPTCENLGKSGYWTNKIFGRSYLVCLTSRVRGSYCSTVQALATTTLLEPYRPAWLKRTQRNTTQKCERSSQSSWEEKTWRGTRRN